MGLNVRAQPDLAAKVLATAAQGSALTVTGYAAANGGWYQVKGTSVTGWISADPVLSAPGQFQAYSSGQFTALYPSGWTATDAPPSGALFTSDRGPDRISMTEAPTVAALPRGRTGFTPVGSSTVVVCGITANLVTYRGTAAASPAAPSSSTATTTTVASTTTTAATPTAGGATTTVAAGGPTTPTSAPPSDLPYLAEIRVAIDPQTALGIYGDLSSVAGPLQTFRQIVASVTFPAQQCTG
ncbi:MAG: SH3 domain-containing protein [Acidobacteriota bacterium]|nr:SH3 domain-containing protein [Acidobacteriota bacterium]